MSITTHEIWMKLSIYLKVDIYDRDGGHVAMDPRQLSMW